MFSERNRRDVLRRIVERLMGLVEKLPGGIQRPILAELVPIREVFLDARYARLVLVGWSGVDAGSFVRSLAGGREVEFGELDNGWRTFLVQGLGGVEILDLRGGISDEVAELALARKSPDLIVVFSDEEGRLEVPFNLMVVDDSAPAVGVARGGSQGVSRMSAEMAAEKFFALRRSRVCEVERVEEIAEEIGLLLPNVAKLEFARLVGARRVQASLAKHLLKSFTAVCGIIGMQPIPLADLPILTSLQVMMVLAIIQVAGRRADLRLAAEFLGALGLNIGAGLIFREGARALVRFVPFWGNWVSGMVAGAGTYAIGRAAIAYFIEELPLNEARKIFQRLAPRRGSDIKGPPPLPT